MSERVIIKNLPSKVKEEKLREHFSEAGLITDIKLMYKKSGEFRGYGFIGFETEEMAKNALKLFHDTYFKKNKMIVEMCSGLDHNKNQEKKEEVIKNDLLIKRQKKQFKDFLKKKDEVTTEKLKEFMNNPDFVDYLSLNQKGTSDLVSSLKKKYSAQVVKDEEPAKSAEDEEEEAPEEDKAANQNISDVEYLKSLMKSTSEETHVSKSTTKKVKEKKWEELFTIVIRTKEQQTNREKKWRTFIKRDVKAFMRPLKCKSLRIPRQTSFVAYVGFPTEKEMNQALMKDNSFLGGVRVRVSKYEKRDKFGQVLDGSCAWKVAEENLKRKASPVAETGKLFVRNLWYSVCEEDLKTLFEKIGPVSDVTLPLSRVTRKSKGFAHITFVFPEDAVKAMNSLDGSSFKGRVIHILPSLADVDEEEATSFKDKKKDALKKSASSWHNWNSLFLGSGAVIDLISKNYSTSKQQLFSSEGDHSVAVNLALGETQIVDETKRFLEEGGVSLEAFTNPGLQRSSTVLLVKNLPALTSAQEVKELFERHGELGRVLLPPSGVTAIIEFLDPGEAKKGFNALAYSRFKSSPLYLEWAPIQVFKGPAGQKVKQELANREPETVIESVGTEEDNAKPSVMFDHEPKTTLYIKNLNFGTDEEAIKQHFSEVGEVRSVIVSRRRGISQGYGFVQFADSSQASKALKLLQNTPLEGHNLLLKFSEKKLTATAKTFRKVNTPGEPTTAKIMIKNIPFQAMQSEIRQLFQTFGEIKAIRLPKKVNSNEHKGFGFVEFITKEEAKKAFDSLGSSTHLYGRRLVLEWAKEDESVEELRRKTADHFLASEPRSKRQRVDPSATDTKQKES